jgi:Multiubiquitin
MQVVALAFDPVPSGLDWVFTVTYRKAARKPHEGTLTEGETVTVRNGTIFNVTATRSLRASAGARGRSIYKCAFEADREYTEPNAGNSGTWNV